MKIISFGAEGKNTISHFLGDKIITSKSFGDTSLADNFSEMKDYVDKLFAEHDFDVILIDKHPVFQSRELAKSYGKEIIEVQHHLAHVYSVAHEHGLKDFIGIAADGLGYGEDGTIWGGEVFHNDKRIGHLEQHKQLGGDIATKYPARMLYSILSGFMEDEKLKGIMGNQFSSEEMTVFSQQLSNDYNTPLTSSCGRVLDAAAALLGICTEMTYSGEPAIKLEQNSTEALNFGPVIEESKLFILETTPLFEFLVENLDEDKGKLAATVQNYLAEGFFRIAKLYNKELPVVFSGGCAYNKIMSTFFKDKGVLTNKNVEPGDPGISYGQIAWYLNND